MSMQQREAIDELLKDGTDDWVSLDEVIWYARQVAGSGPGAGLGGIVGAVVFELVDRGLMLPGILGVGGFEAWSGSPQDLVARVIEACRLSDWSPMGAGCWFANTPAGDQAAAEATQ